MDVSAIKPSATHSREAADVPHWNRIKFTPVDYRALAETEDRTKLADVAACANDAVICE